VQSPVFGGRVKSVDDAAAKAINGVRQIVRLDDAVAVVADHMGAAKKGLAALVIEWDGGPHAKLDTDAVARELENATLGSGAVDRDRGEPRGSAPPTPPCVRVRTRRFEKLR
jgi:isoquinoline 1-oxidoreductase beta subunit